MTLRLQNHGVIVKGRFVYTCEWLLETNTNLIADFDGTDIFRVDLMNGLVS